MKKGRNWGPMLIALPVLWMSGTVWLVGCGPDIMYPTVTDVNERSKAQNEFIAGENQATRDQMQEEHGIQSPELVDALAQVSADAAFAIKQLRERVDAVEAKGADVGDLGSFGELGGGLIPKLLSMFGFGSLIPIYSMFFGKSRAQKEIDELKSKMAVSAPAGESFPGEKPA